MVLYFFLAGGAGAAAMAAASRAAKSGVGRAEDTRVNNERGREANKKEKDMPL